MSWKTDLIEAVATVKANTENHNGELKEFKTTFFEHKKEDAKDVLYMKKKIETLQCTIANLDCPHEKKMDELDEKLEEKVKADVVADKVVEGRISKLEGGKKLNYLSIGGIFTLIGVILKKIYSSS